MENNTEPDQHGRANEQASPEVLQPRVNPPTQKPEASTGQTPGAPIQQAAKPPHRSYRPSHKATFISLAVVLLILGINGVVLSFILGSKTSDSAKQNGQVTISSDVLNKLGVSRDASGSSGTILTVGPDAVFKGTVTIAKDADISGALKLNGKLTASDASLGQLQAGNTSFSQLGVNGNSTLTTLNVRNQLVVAGATQLQGAVTIAQLLTVNNNLNISGNLAIGGSLTSTAINTTSLTSSGTLIIGGHIITGGSTPFVSSGSAIGSNGTVSISGNDAAGTVAVNIGVGGGNGTVVNVSFRSAYGNTPHVVITPVGSLVSNYYVSRSSAGFSIAVSGLGPGGYAFDYIVEQ